MTDDERQKWKESTWASMRATLEECFAEVDAGTIVPRAAMVCIVSARTDAAKARLCLAGMATNETPEDVRAAKLCLEYAVPMLQFVVGTIERADKTPQERLSEAEAAVGESDLDEGC